MGTGKKDRGFHAPFATLKKLKAKAPNEPMPPPKPQRSEARPAAADDDASLFLRAMQGTARLQDTSKRVPAPPVAVLPPPTDDALAVAELEELVNGQRTFVVSESEEMYTGVAPGVNDLLLERLQKGHFAFHLHLDLHGRSREAAHAAVARFVGDARRAGERCVLIITGRGKSSPGGLSVLREALPRWLCRAPIKAHVLAFCTARAVDGGPGAFYVLLRRSGVKPFGTESLP